MEGFTRLCYGMKRYQIKRDVQLWVNINAMRKYRDIMSELKKIVRFVPLVLFLADLFYLFLMYIVSLIMGRTVTIENF